MVRGRVIALPQKEQVKTGPLINEPHTLPTTHWIKVGPCYYMFVH